MADIEGVLAGLDSGTAERARRALLWIGVDGLSTLTQLQVQRFVWVTLPQVYPEDQQEHHETAWALADFLAAAGLTRYADLCRDRRTHEVLSAWARDPGAGERLAAALLRSSGVQPPDTVLLTFSEVPTGQEAEVQIDLSRVLETAVVEGRLDPAGNDFDRLALDLAEQFLTAPSPDHGGRTPLLSVLRWRALRWVLELDAEFSEFWVSALHRIYEEPVFPGNLQLSTAPAEALLQTADTAPVLTPDGQLPDEIVADLDARFGWSDKLPLGRTSMRYPLPERSVPALLFVDTHLRAQGLLTRSEGRLVLTPLGRRCLLDRRRLWKALVAARPRWEKGFDEDALAVMAAVLLRRTPSSASALTRHATSLLRPRWQSHGGDSVRSAVEWLRVEWYRLGVGFSWWEVSRHADDYRLSRFGRAAAAELFWSVAARPLA